MIWIAFVVAMVGIVGAGAWVWLQLAELTAHAVALHRLVELQDRAIASLDGDLDASNAHLFGLTERVEALAVRRTRK